MFANSPIINPFLVMPSRPGHFAVQAKESDQATLPSRNELFYKTVWFCSLIDLLTLMFKGSILSREIPDELPLEYVSCAMFNVVAGFVTEEYSESFCGTVQKISDLTNIEKLQAGLKKRKR
jgi:hypothetical protein